MHFTQEELLEIIKKAIEKGFEHYSKGESEQAAALYKQILCVDEDNVIALQMLGLIESRLPNMCQEGLKKLKRAEELDPDNADVHNNLGLVYSWSDIKDIHLGIAHYEKAIALAPQNLHFYSNLGIHLKSMEKPEEAEDAFIRGLAINDDSSMLHFNYATLLGEWKRWDDAEYHYKRALDLDKDFAACHYNLSTVYLGAGDLVKGWPEYEWRWDAYPQFKKIYQRFPDEKMWHGDADPSGKRFLLYAEQGMGDTIQFARFISILRDRGAKIVFEEDSDLYSLMKTLDGPEEIIKLGDKIEEFDYHCSVVSLPYLLGFNKLEDIPSEPYLKCNYADLPEMSILEEKHWLKYDGLRVGIVWAGNPVHRHDPWRSTLLKYFKPLQMPGVNIFSLQKDIRPRVWPGFGEHDLTKGADDMKIVDLKDFMIDYNGSAALIDRMDLIISVDTATAHLAAAMGKPVWLLTAFHNDWRWLRNVSSSPWYKTLRIYRQPKQKDWDSVFTEVERDLRDLVKAAD